MATQIQRPRPTSAGQAKPAGGMATPVSGARRRRWDAIRVMKTLRGQFVILAVLLLALAVVLGLIAQSAFRRANDDLNAIAVESVPSIDAAQEMGQSIQDMDVKAADFLAPASLKTSVSCVLPVTQYQPGTISLNECDDMTINADITLFNQALYNAAHNVTFPGAQTAVLRISAGFEEYVSDITVMREEYAQASNKTNVQDAHMQLARQAYNSASNVLLLHITRDSALDTYGLNTYNEEDVPSCVIDDPLGKQDLLSWEWPNGSLETNIECLGSINKAHLEAAYENTQATLTGMLVALIMLSLGLCVFLIVVTVRMAVITHRLINPGLTLAMLLAIILSVPLLSNYGTLAGRHGVFGEMVRDDYDSVYYAADLSRYAAAANADDQHWQIALQDGDQPQVTRWSEEEAKNKQRIEILIGRAKANRTWVEEDRPLSGIQQYWSRYKAELTGKGGFSQNFDTFESAVARLGAANRSHFESRYSAAVSTTAADAMWAIILLPVIGLLAVWGVWLRLKDF